MKNYTLVVAIACISLLLISCDDTKKQSYTHQTEIENERTAYTNNNHPGKKLMETLCYACHNPSASHDARIAPPMVAIKSHYLDDDMTKKEFGEAIWNFVKKPSKEKTKMRGAVRRFGVMPYQQFSQKDIELIADYMYEFKIEEPEWFKEHIQEKGHGNMKYRNDGKKAHSESNQDEKKQTPAERGMNYALTTKKELAKNLLGTIQKKGTLEAVSFCNKKAYPLTDSMATAQNATIKRVSDKPRNTGNQATEKELKMIAHFKEAVAANTTYTPVTEIENGNVHFYAPITTNTMCLQCHGSPEKDINPNVLSKLLQLYPNDKATGYGVNEVRGIWSITFEE